ncbi:hypothetical protein ACFX1Q_008206 [Malus domestica]
MAVTMVTASTMMGLGSSSLSPSRTSLSSGFVKPIVVDDPLRQVKAYGGRGSREDDGGDGKGLSWKLPVLGTQQLGKVGPAFGLGTSCDLGFDIGLLGCARFGPGISGLQVVLSLGAGCGVCLGFGVAIQKE